MYKVVIVCPGTNSEVIRCMTRGKVKRVLNRFLDSDARLNDAGLLYLPYAGFYEVWHNSHKMGTFCIDGDGTRALSYLD